jgi:hypothetical protein
MLDFLVVALRAVAAVVLIVSALLAAHAAGWWLVGARRVPLRLGATLAAGMWISTIAFVALRPLGLFKIGVAAPLGLLVALAVLRLPATRERLALDARVMRRVWRAHLRSRQRGSTTVLLSLAAVFCLRALLLPPLGWDSITYHGVRAALWLQTGQITFDPAPSTWSIHRNYFAGAEVLFAWAMLPFHSDLLFGLSTAAQWLAVAAGMWALARALELPEPLAGTCAQAALFISPLPLLVASGYVEPALYACLLVGLAAGVEYLRRPCGRLLVLAGAALGLAVGMKPTAAGPAGVMALVLLLRAVGRREDRAWLVAALAVMAAPILPWTWQAYRDTGHPLSPLPLRVLGLTLGVADPAMQWYLQSVDPGPLGWSGELAALRAIFAPPGEAPSALGATSLLPLALLPVGLGRLGVRRRAAALALALALLTVVGFYLSGGMKGLRLEQPLVLSRHLVLAVLIPLPLGGWALRGWPRALRLYCFALVFAAAYNAIFLVRLGAAAHEATALWALAAALLTLGWLATRARSLAVAGGLFVVASVGLQSCQDVTRATNVRDSVVLHNVWRYWTPAASLVDEPGTSHFIAVTSGPRALPDHWFTYFFLGRRFQNRLTYVPVTRDGHIEPFGPAGNLEAVADRPSWLARLKSRGITEIMAFSPRAIELQWMTGDPVHFEPLSIGPDWGFFRLVP